MNNGIKCGNVKKNTTFPHFISVFLYFAQNLNMRDFYFYSFRAAILNLTKSVELNPKWKRRCKVTHYIFISDIFTIFLRANGLTLKNFNTTTLTINHPADFLCWNDGLSEYYSLPRHFSAPSQYPYLSFHFAFSERRSSVSLGLSCGE